MACVLLCCDKFGSKEKQKAAPGFLDAGEMGGRREEQEAVEKWQLSS